MDISFSLFINKFRRNIIIIIKPIIKIIATVYASRCKPGAGHGALKRQDKQLPDPTGPLSFIILADAIRDANDAHTITTD